MKNSKNIAVVVAIISLVGTISAAIIGKISCPSSNSIFPEFHLKKGVCYHPDSAILVQAKNNTAKKDEPIIFDIDSFPYDDAAVPQKKDRELFWDINLLKLKLPKPIRKDGEHTVCFGFSREKMSRSRKIYFDSTEPHVVGGYVSEPNGENRIYGKIFDSCPKDTQNILVELTLKQQHQLITINMPVSCYIYSNGSRLYEYNYTLQDISRIVNSKINYAEPFFVLTIKDEAGNAFFRKTSYDDIIAKKAIEFGTDTARKIIKKIEKGGDIIKVIQDTLQAKPILTFFPNKQPTLIDSVRYRELTGWRGKIYFSNDTLNLLASEEKESKPSKEDTLKLSENRENIIKEVRKMLLRSEPATLSEEQVKFMLKEKGLFDRYWNTSGKGFNNKFELQIYKEKNVIMDYITGLMWQQSGSPDLMNYEEAKKWIQYLNQKGFASYHDWRLPSLEEAMSLMEREQKNGDLYIDPIFEKRQRWIWTSDLYKGESHAWVVDISSGRCDLGFDIFNSYVRAVRSGQSSAE